MRAALSIIIPAFDEEARLAPTLDAILDYARSREEPFEVIVVDDGSRDATAEVARRYAGRGVRLLESRRNRGKGAALRRGVGASRGDRVLLTDADLSTPIEELERLEPLLDEVEIVFGSRAMADSRITRRQPFYREWMGKTFNRLIRLFGVGGLGDSQCGFKLLAGPTARELFERLTIDGFAYDVELVWVARQAGYRIREVGVQWENSPSSRVHPIFDSYRMLTDLVRIRWRHRGGARATGGRDG